MPGTSDLSPYFRGIENRPLVVHLHRHRTALSDNIDQQTIHLNLPLQGHDDVLLELLLFTLLTVYRHHLDHQSHTDRLGKVPLGPTLLIDEAQCALNVFILAQAGIIQGQLALATDVHGAAGAAHLYSWPSISYLV